MIGGCSSEAGDRLEQGGDPGAAEERQSEYFLLDGVLKEPGIGVGDEFLGGVLLELRSVDGMSSDSGNPEYPSFLWRLSAIEEVDGTVVYYQTVNNGRLRESGGPLWQCGTTARGLIVGAGSGDEFRFETDRLPNTEAGFPEELVQCASIEPVGFITLFDGVFTLAPLDDGGLGLTAADGRSARFAPV